MPLPLPLPTKLKKSGQGKEHKSRNLSNVRTKAYPRRTFISPPISSWFGHFADLPMPTGRSLVWSSPTLWPCLLENEPRWTFAIERIIKSTRALRSHVQQVVLKTQFFSSNIATLTCWDSWDWLAAGHNQFLSTCNVCNQQGGRTWQPFVGRKNGNENFRQACICNFLVKCVVFARNRKFAKLNQ